MINIEIKNVSNMYTELAFVSINVNLFYYSCVRNILNRPLYI